jgi:hypothetical protein
MSKQTQTQTETSKAPSKAPSKAEKAPEERVSMDVAAQVIADDCQTVPIGELASVAKSIRGTLLRKAVLARFAPPKAS